jgi:uncharacterized protein YecT (DUF1311 family)
MTRLAPSLLVSALLLCAACTHALGQHMNAPGVSCNRPSSTVEGADCFAKASDAADKELNGLYAQVRSVLGPEERSDLLEAQRAWLRYRDLTCSAEYKLYGGGTGGPVTRMACLAAITQERTGTLRTTYGWRLEK